jgi:hypothetical protein
MALAVATCTLNTYPTGVDNTQRSEWITGKVAITPGPATYTAGGIRMNFTPLEQIKVPPQAMLPFWCDVESQSGSGYWYIWNPLGAAITNLALTSNVVTITAANNLAAGDVVQLNGLTTTPGLNGTSVVVLAGGLSAASFTANLVHANIGSGAETGFCTPTSYASGLPFQGNLQIFTTGTSSGSKANEFATGAIITAISGDVIGGLAGFSRIG